MIRLVDKPKILVVNDDANSLFALTNLLEQWAALQPPMADGTITPPIGGTYALEEFGPALVDLEERRATGKLVVRVR